MTFPLPIRNIREVCLELLSPEEIKAHSVVEIEHAEDIDEAGDPRLGPANYDSACHSCGRKRPHCPGHFGHIQLARPVFHPGFLFMVKKILESICLNCAKLKLDVTLAEEIERIGDPRRRRNAVWRHCKTNMLCEAGYDESGCAHPQPRILKRGLQLWMSQTDNEPRAISPSQVRQILQKISNDDLHLLGLSGTRPEWMVLTVLPVPPSQVDEGHDRLARKLSAIVEVSAELRRCEKDGLSTEQLEKLLQFHVTTYLDNELVRVPQTLRSSHMSLRTPSVIANGQSDMKRVEFAAPPVITSDPNLELNELGVPSNIAMDIMYPERVTQFNIGQLRNVVGNGGACCLVRETGERIDPRRDMVVVDIGWVVERYLKDGDFVLFGHCRHREHLQSYKVKLLPFSTFHLNPVTLSLLGCLDAEEMEIEMHIPQDIKSRAELTQNLWAPRPYQLARSNKAFIATWRDTILGLRKLALRDTFLDWSEVQNLVLWIPHWNGTIPVPAIVKPKLLWSGKQILSMIIPRGIDFYSPSYDSNRNSPELLDVGLLIEDGNMLWGTFDAKSHSRLFGVVFLEKGPDAARELLFGLQLVTNHWLFHTGFTVGIGDLILDNDTMVVVTRRVEDCKNDVSQDIEDTTHDRLRRAPGMTIRESFEQLVHSRLIVARDSSGSFAQHQMKATNNIKQMAATNSTRSFIDIARMSVCVGQQWIESQQIPEWKQSHERIPFGFKNRTLPHFSQDDFGPASRGFVESSYINGLKPHEFFFSAMASRSSSIGQANRTAEMLHMKRQLVDALEDLVVCYDGTVRDSAGNVFQFLYGDDGMDVVFVERQELPTFASSDSDFSDAHRVPTIALSSHNTAFAPEEAKYDEEYQQLLEDRQFLQNVVLQANQTAYFYLPVNVERIINNAIRTFRINSREPSDLEPVYVIDTVKALSERLVVVHGEGLLSRAANEDAVLLFCICFRSMLMSHRIVEELCLTRAAFDWILAEVESRFYRSVVSPGEMCGILAACSIGAPQMGTEPTYVPGASLKPILLGIPRLEEIFNVVHDIKTPSLTVYLDPELSKERVLALGVFHQLESVHLRDVVSAMEVYYDPDPTSTIIAEDYSFVSDFFAIPDAELESTLHLHSPWLLRLELNRMKMVGRFTMAYVASCIAQTFKSDMSVLWSEDNADQLVIRCRIVGGYEEEEEDILLQHLGNTMLDSIRLCGVKGIHKAFFDAVRLDQA
ncbi:DNA-directed RNA polymerase subunit [Mycena indigotica]|uniref:DNA-directed RNA polymerase subunit n=1 Tax=Mycena indigotica TaxID=2126181 RepID=A0A8H6WDN1_9AGAR|nr:DNA-directed RNA polymerase subunit [Mycena indigotica]KAF7312676.1 DNA-directed RNA polymerase subunit [Mycena indigotica]